MRRPLAAFLILLLTGCAASAQTRSASVNMAALLPKHPLYGTLAQYDRQIAALQATLHTRFANSGAQIDNANAAIRHDLDHASNATRNLSKRARPVDVTLRQTQGQSAANAPSAGAIESGIQQAYNQQHSQLRGTAQRDMAEYRATLFAQEQIAYDTFVRSVNDRTQRAYRARAQELHEREAGLLLDLARNDAPQRLLLRAKLQALALDGATRRRFQARLAALQTRENAALNAMHAVDAHTLGAYAAQLRGRAQSDIAKMNADLQARANANLAARQRVLTAQTSTASSLRLPANRARAGSSIDMQAQYDTLVNSQRADTTAFSNARDDLGNSFHALRDADANNTASIRSQIAWLQHDREAVRKRMIAQIMLEAKREAQAHGLSQVNATNHSQAGSIDLTSAVAADLRQISP